VTVWATFAVDFWYGWQEDAVVWVKSPFHTTNLWIEVKECVKYPRHRQSYRQVAFFVSEKRESGGGYVTTEAAPTGLQGLKVMVIDDSKTIRRTAETLLKKEGCEVITANDGFEALSKIADHNPNIIFVDIMMPRLDGYQTCALIKHNQKFKNTPVIMLSSKDGLFDRARGRIVGSEQYLTKPFTKEELLGAIQQHVLKNAS
jgi:twitching motility two-component system response regulator PilG